MRIKSELKSQVSNSIITEIYNPKNVENKSIRKYRLGTN